MDLWFLRSKTNPRGTDARGMTVFLRIKQSHTSNDQNGTIFFNPVFFFFLLEELPWSVVELDEDELAAPAADEDPFSISFI